MQYTKSHERLLLGTSTGILSMLPEAAEKISDFDEEEGHEEQKEKNIEHDLHSLGRYHTERVNGVRPLGTSTQMVSISADMTVALWETTT